MDPDTILSTHGVVHGLALCIQTLTAPGEGIIIFTPVYHVFSQVIEANGRRIVASPLIEKNGRYEMDLDGLEAALSGQERMLILCSPHNPGGRVWTTKELAAVHALCDRHGIMLVADEIHHDLVYSGFRHVVAAHNASSPSDAVVVLTAATKRFNIAGGQIRNMISPNKVIRDKLEKRIKADDITPTVFGVKMTEAAYRYGEDWLVKLLDYLQGNVRFFERELGSVPGVVPMKLQSTYLSWIDFSGLNLLQDDLRSRLSNSARIIASRGDMFGAQCGQFFRFNLATQRTLVTEAVSRL